MDYEVSKLNKTQNINQHLLSFFTIKDLVVKADRQLFLICAVEKDVNYCSELWFSEK
jgi:hypothetical protein